MERMDEELLKRNTDCVYFLASPFTCKKGVECEYRHSEMARLNPRDCWYWLSGNCLNPTCGFRHPPMDVQTEASAQADVLPNNSSFPPSKNNFPCYFYFNGYCNKGDKCPFLHGSEGISAGKPKIDSISSDAPPLDTKMPSETSAPKISAEPLDAKAATRALNTKVHSRMLDTKTPARMMDRKVCAIAEPVLDQPEKCRGMLETARNAGDKAPLQQKKPIQSSDAYSILEQKTLQDSLASEYEEAAVSKSASLNHPENIAKSDPSIYSDQSFEEQVDEDVARDEWWESSPGFDVLVEGRSEGMAYGDEHEYIHSYNDGYDGHDEDHENHLLDHSYEDQHDYSDSFLHQNRAREPSYYSDVDESYDLLGYSHGDRENRNMSQKRKFLRVGLPNGGHYSVDLREHLSKRRFHDGYPERHAFRHRDFPFYTKESQGEPQWSGSTQRLHWRLASKLERNGVSLPTEKSASVVPNHRDRASKSHLTNYRHNHERKRLRFFPRVQRRPFTRQKRHNENSSSFTGPKTLSQIKEEKDRAREDPSCFSETRHSGQNSSIDFEAPKSLSEILKKKKTGNMGGEDNINSSY